MAQHDYVISNGTGAAVRSDLNNALAAIVSQNSGATAPSPTYAFQFWADTTAGVLKLRNSANSAWITLFQLDGEWTTLPVENGTAAAPSIYFKDSGTDTGFYSPGTDQVAISTGGTGRLFINSSGSVGIGTSSPSYSLHSTGKVFAYSGFRLGTGYSAIDVETGAGGLYLSGAQGALNHAYIDSSGRLGIGVTSAESLLHLNSGGTAQIQFGTPTLAPQGYISYTSAGSEYLDIKCRGTNSGYGNIRFFTGNVGSAAQERATITNDGKLLLGTSSSFDTNCTLQAVGASAAQFFRWGADGCDVYIGCARGTQGSPSALVNGDIIGTFRFRGYDGGAYRDGASIAAVVDAGVGASDFPSRLVFSTTADGASSPTERMRIVNTGDVLINKTVVNDTTAGFRWSASNYFSAVRNGGGVAYFNRLTDDGILVEFAQDSVQEGNISVSGTTVSYNGAHLSRWSQLPSGANRTEILRGSVLSNIDEMCEWDDEENEQLNRMKVSDVEGDKNVSGVFQAWDDDDDTYVNDFYCAMTGDFIIRIGAGVTVERGDLLMSAGDGTAKPQDDDIIRSKTIAKVTSTNVSCTYDDGSYCVPCVLMAC